MTRGHITRCLGDHVDVDLPVRRTLSPDSIRVNWRTMKLADGTIVVVRTTLVDIHKGSIIHGGLLVVHYYYYCGHKTM